MISKQQLGKAGELQARQYLERRGYTFLAANVRTAFGELDLLMRDGQTLVAVEVKARSTPLAGAAAESVSRRQLARVCRAVTWCASRYRFREYRVDLVAVEPGRVEHILNLSEGAMLY